MIIKHYQALYILDAKIWDYFWKEKKEKNSVLTINRIFYNLITEGCRIFYSDSPEDSLQNSIPIFYNT